jgi:hypothetical protein
MHSPRPIQPFPGVRPHALKSGPTRRQTLVRARATRGTGRHCDSMPTFVHAASSLCWRRRPVGCRVGVGPTRRRRLPSVGGSKRTRPVLPPSSANLLCSLIFRGSRRSTDTCVKPRSRARMNLRSPAGRGFGSASGSAPGSAATAREIADVDELSGSPTTTRARSRPSDLVGWRPRACN